MQFCTHIRSEKRSFPANSFFCSLLKCLLTTEIIDSLSEQRIISSFCIAETLFVTKIKKKKKKKKKRKNALQMGADLQHFVLYHTIYFNVEIWFNRNSVLGYIFSGPLGALSTF